MRHLHSCSTALYLINTLWAVLVNSFRPWTLNRNIVSWLPVHFPWSGLSAFGNSESLFNWISHLSGSRFRDSVRGLLFVAEKLQNGKRWKIEMPIMTGHPVCTIKNKDSKGFAVILYKNYFGFQKESFSKKFNLLRSVCLYCQLGFGFFTMARMLSWTVNVVRTADMRALWCGGSFWIHALHSEFAGLRPRPFASALHTIKESSFNHHVKAIWRDQTHLTKKVSDVKHSEKHYKMQHITNMEINGYW